MPAVEVEILRLNEEGIGIGRLEKKEIMVRGPAR